ncbi:MAG TPA: SCO1664 family protein [Actinomycetota bacterium]|nr:SCO1664 family protein [Actinomycetota bacterium]
MPRDERSFESELTTPHVPTVVESGSLELLGLLPNSSNYTFLARVSSPDDKEALVVYKPLRGESPLWDFPEGSLGRREVAACVIATTLGWPNVPATVLRDGPEGIGSVQVFVPYAPQEHYFTLQERHGAEFREIAAFDLVVNNADRKAGHCLLGGDGRIWAIDHGVCFHAEPKLRTVIWEYMGEPIPRRLIEDVGSLGEALGKGAFPCDQLADLLAADEIAALIRRIEALIDDPVFPAPTGERPYPWPPV